VQDEEMMNFEKKELPYSGGGDLWDRVFLIGCGDVPACLNRKMDVAIKQYENARLVKLLLFLSPTIALFKRKSDPECQQ
jgi:hypothetical protein